MAKFVTYILSVLLFIGSPILHTLKFPVEGYAHNYFYPSFYILVLAIGSIFCFKDISLTSTPNRQIATLLLSVLLFCCGFGIVRHAFNKPLLIDSIALPALYGLFFANIDRSMMDGVRRIMLLMFAVNCVFAIYERLFMHNVFSMQLIYRYMEFSQTDPGTFRSSALLGHPLTNALITSIIMSFITVSALKRVYKSILLLLGFFALVCFNARGATVISGLFTFIYLGQKFFSRYEPDKSRIQIAIFFIALTAMLFLLFSNGFGGRFFESAWKNDASILSRIKVWKLFEDISVESLLFGLENVKGYARSILGTFHVENWLLLSILQIGIVPTLLFIVLYVPIFRYFLVPFTRFQSIFLMGTFISVASTNNSLASGVPAISVFFVCALAFTPEYYRLTLLKRILKSGKTEMANRFV